VQDPDNNNGFEAPGAHSLPDMRQPWEVCFGAHPPTSCLKWLLSIVIIIQMWVTPLAKKEEVGVDSLTFEWTSSEDYSHDPHMFRVIQGILSYSDH
jgi:hypothetical protein